MRRAAMLRCASVLMVPTGAFRSVQGAATRLARGSVDTLPVHMTTAIAIGKTNPSWCPSGIPACPANIPHSASRGIATMPHVSQVSAAYAPAAAKHIPTVTTEPFVSPFRALSGAQLSRAATSVCHPAKTRSVLVDSVPRCRDQPGTVFKRATFVRLMKGPVSQATTASASPARTTDAFQAEDCPTVPAAPISVSVPRLSVEPRSALAMGSSETPAQPHTIVR